MVSWITDLSSMSKLQQKVSHNSSGLFNL